MRAWLLTGALCAFTTHSVIATATEDAAAKPAEHQFLDKSIVSVPEQVDRYKLVDVQFDPAQWTSGVSTTWQVEDAPKLKLDVYVYPLGRVEEAEMVKRQLAEVEGAVQEASKQGLYETPVLGERQEFVVVRPEGSLMRDGKKKRPRFDPDPKHEPDEHIASNASALEKALAESTPPPNNHGLRLNLSYVRDGHTKRSLAYVFYRHLFGFKVRASVDTEDMTQEAFEAAADRATRWLVPQIAVESFGACGTVEIYMPDLKPGEKEDADAKAAELIRGMARVQRENCATDPGTSKPEPGMKLVEIDYPAGIWKSE